MVVVDAERFLINENNIFIMYTFILFLLRFTNNEDLEIMCREIELNFMIGMN